MSIENQIKQVRRELGRNVENERARKGLTERELAAACGLPESELAAIERGERDVPIDTLAALSAALEVPLPQLFES